MILKNKFGHVTHGLPSFYWRYRFDKISNYITYDEYLERNVEPGFYFKNIRKNAIEALERKVCEANELVHIYSSNKYYVSEFKKDKEYYENKIEKIRGNR